MNAFAEAVAMGMSQSDAYRKAYAADSMSLPTIWSEASRLAHHPKVAARVAEITAELEVENRRQRGLLAAKVLSDLHELARTANSDHARIRAIELLGRNLNLFA